LWSKIHKSLKHIKSKPDAALVLVVYALANQWITEFGEAEKKPREFSTMGKTLYQIIQVVG